MLCRFSIEAARAPAVGLKFHFRLPHLRDSRKPPTPIESHSFREPGAFQDGDPLLYRLRIDGGELASMEDKVDRPHEICSDTGLEHVTGCTEVKGCIHKIYVFMHRQKNNLGTGFLIF